MSRKTKSKPITLALPDEFIALCASDGVAPELVLRGFIADLCEIMSWAAAAKHWKGEQRHNAALSSNLTPTRRRWPATTRSSTKRPRATVKVLLGLK